jgi:hypothetical protein
VSSTNSSSDSTTRVDWGFFPKIREWFSTVFGSISLLLITFLFITALGRVLTTHKVNHDHLSPPDWLYQDDLFYLNDNVIPPPQDVVTLTLTSQKPFSILVDGEETDTPAAREFDQKYWIKGLVIKGQGFRITKAEERVRLYSYTDGHSFVEYTLESKHGYPLIEKTEWFISSWLVRILILIVCTAIFSVWLDELD